MSDLFNVEIKKFKSSYYSVSYGLTALKIHHDTVHQKVGLTTYLTKNPLYSIDFEL